MTYPKDVNSYNDWLWFLTCLLVENYCRWGGGIWGNLTKYRNDVTMAQFVFLSVARNFPRNFARYRLCYCRNWKWQQISILNTFIGYDLSKWRQKCSILCSCETTRLRLLVPLEVLNILTSFKRPQYLNTFPETFTRFARGGHKIVFHPPTYNMIYQFYNFYNFLSYCNFFGGEIISDCI